MFRRLQKGWCCRLDAFSEKGLTILAWIRCSWRSSTPSGVTQSDHYPVQRIRPGDRPTTSALRIANSERGRNTRGHSAGRRTTARTRNAPRRATGTHAARSLAGQLANVAQPSRRSPRKNSQRNPGREVSSSCLRSQDISRGSCWPCFDDTPTRAITVCTQPVSKKSSARSRLPAAA